MQFALLFLGIPAILLWTYAFTRSPFRPSLIIILYSIFSFMARPIAVMMCDQFVPFYYFNIDGYALGVVIANACILVYMIGYVAALKTNSHAAEIDLFQLKRLSWHTSAYAMLVMLGALLIYGNSILPGFRSTGLSKAAPGSQVFFAIFSILIVPAIALRILIVAKERSGFSGRLRGALTIGFLMVISLLFYQRGPAIQGVALGLYFLVLSTPRNEYIRLLKVSVVFLLFAGLVVLNGRAAISAVMGAVYGHSPSSYVFEVVERGAGCRLAMMGTQEHDQVWPAVVDYVDSNGVDGYRNLLAAFLRPFLSSDQRAHFNMQTSVDTLNIFNDADTYLDRNFGFSISLWQYHYFSMGIFIVPLSLVLGFVSSRLENKIERVRNLNLEGFSFIFLTIQLIILVNNAIDERLKWVVLTIVVFLGVIFLLRVRIRS